VLLYVIAYVKFYWSNVVAIAKALQATMGDSRSTPWKSVLKYREAGEPNMTAHQEHQKKTKKNMHEVGVNVLLETITSIEKGGERVGQQ
jgi:hypothetical protein